MNNRQLNIASAILQVLDQTSEYMMPETALRPQVNLQVRPLVMQHEFEQVLTQLEADKNIYCPNPEEPVVRRWHITDMGKLKLKEWTGA
jgi:hypothetical protein